MGEKQSKIYVEIPQQYVYAGQQLYGYVNLYVPDKPIQSPGIEILIQGKQMIKYKDKQKKNEEKTEECELIRFQQSINLWDDSIPKGQYRIPFSFQVPQNCPPSSFSKGDNHEFQIKYKVKAYLKNEITSNKNLSHKQSFYIQQMSAQQNRVYKNEEFQLVSKSCWCCNSNQGRSEITVSTERDNYQIGNQINFEIKINNLESQRSTTNVMVQLIKDTQLINQSGVEVYSKQKDILEVSNSSFEKEKEKQKPLNISLSMNLDKGKVPSPSSISKMGSNTYKLKYLIKYQGGLQKEIIQEIVINSNQIQDKSPELPQGWAPQDLPMQMITQISKQSVASLRSEPFFSSEQNQRDLQSQIDSADQGLNQATQGMEEIPDDSKNTKE